MPRRVPNFRPRRAVRRVDRRPPSCKRGPYGTKAWEQKRLEVFVRDGGMCRICGLAVTGEWDIDHIVPISQGGDPWADSNLQLAHHDCHSRKTASES